jgi:MFS family permease
VRNWFVILALTFGPVVSNSLARFGYALVLPAMKNDLDWSYTVSGWINTSNALGYLIGALIALYLSNRVSPARLFSFGMVLTTLSILSSGLVEDVTLLSLMRLLAGIGGAPVFIAGAAMVAKTWPDEPSKNTLAIAIYFGGAGAGILATGVTLPYMLEWWGQASWPLAWIAMGAASIVMCLISIPAALSLKTETAKPVKMAVPLPAGRMMASLAGYFFFAAGYIVYMTFIIAWLQENGAGVEFTAFCWSILGIGVMLSPFFWRPVLNGYENGFPLAATTLATGIGSMIPLLFSGLIGVRFSALIFGLSFFIAPASVTAFSRKNLKQNQLSAAVALYTVVFAVGQTLGPVGAGWVSDLSGDLANGLKLGVGLLFLGAFLGMFQKKLN